MKGGKSFVGEVVPSSDVREREFSSMVLGCRAVAMDLKTKIGKDGLTTIAKLIAVYAPPIENDTEAYITAVCREANISRNIYLLPSSDIISSLTPAIIHHENGPGWIDAQTIQSGINLAFGVPNRA